MEVRLRFLKWEWECNIKTLRSPAPAGLFKILGLSYNKFMGIFDFLTDTTKKIYRREFNQALGKISSLSSKERKYLNEVFKSDLSDGLSEYEVKQRIAKLRYNTTDSLDSYEIEQVKKKLLGELRK